MAKMNPYKRAVAVTGSYQDRNGQEKKRYVSVGTLFQYDDGGLALKLDCVPVGQGFNGFISFYDIEDSRQQGGGQRTRGHDDGQPSEEFSADSDDIPW